MDVAEGGKEEGGKQQLAVAHSLAQHKGISMYGMDEGIVKEFIHIDLCECICKQIRYLGE